MLNIMLLEIFQLNHQFSTAIDLLEWLKSRTQTPTASEDVGQQGFSRGAVRYAK